MNKRLQFIIVGTLIALFAVAADLTPINAFRLLRLDTDADGHGNSFTNLNTVSASVFLQNGSPISGGGSGGGNSNYDQAGANIAITKLNGGTGTTNVISYNVSSNNLDKALTNGNVGIAALDAHSTLTISNTAATNATISGTVTTTNITGNATRMMVNNMFGGGLYQYGMFLDPTGVLVGFTNTLWGTGLWLDNNQGHVQGVGGLNWNGTVVLNATLVASNDTWIHGPGSGSQEILHIDNPLWSYNDGAFIAHGSNGAYDNGVVIDTGGQGGIEAEQYYYSYTNVAANYSSTKFDRNIYASAASGNVTITMLPFDNPSVEGNNGDQINWTWNGIRDGFTNGPANYTIDVWIYRTDTSGNTLTVTSSGASFYSTAKFINLTGQPTSFTIPPYCGVHIVGNATNNFVDQFGTNWGIGGGGGSGSVTSVTFTGDGVVDSSTPSSAVTTTGTVTATIKNQSANTILAGPSSGSAAASAFRSLVYADVPATIQTASSQTLSNLQANLPVNSAGQFTGSVSILGNINANGGSLSNIFLYSANILSALVSTMTVTNNFTLSNAWVYATNYANWLFVTNAASIGGALTVGGAATISNTVAGSNFLFIAQGTGVAMDLNKGLATNFESGNFTLGAPVNVTASLFSTPVMVVSNSSGSPITVSCPSTWVTNNFGIPANAWSLTNMGAFYYIVIPGMKTNVTYVPWY